jgi:hypothetical protein
MRKAVSLWIVPSLIIIGVAVTNDDKGQLMTDIHNYKQRVCKTLALKREGRRFVGVTLTSHALKSSISRDIISLKRNSSPNISFSLVFFEKGCKFSHLSHTCYMPLLTCIQEVPALSLDRGTSNLVVLMALHSPPCK